MAGSKEYHRLPCLVARDSRKCRNCLTQTQEFITPITILAPRGLHIVHTVDFVFFRVTGRINSLFFLMQPSPTELC
jgi:hypothetical protein